MAHVFISYRREDSADATGRLYDRLSRHFGPETVFKDVDSILSGEDFRAAIVRAIERCQSVLVVIGPKWAGIPDRDGKRRLENPADPVRLEIEAALRIGVPIIPVLVTQAEMPVADSLPDSLVQLAFRNAARVRQDPDFHGDVDRLLRDLDVITAAHKRLAAGGALAAGGVRPARSDKLVQPRRRGLVPGLVGLTLGLGIAAAAATIVFRPKPEVAATNPPAPVLQRTATVSLKSTLVGEGGPVTSLSISPNGEQMLTIAPPPGQGEGASPFLWIWDLGTGKLILKLDLLESNVRTPVAVAYRPDGNHFAILDGDGILTTFDAKTNKRLGDAKLNPPDGAEGNPASFEYRADGKTVFCLGSAWAGIYEVESGERVSSTLVGSILLGSTLATTPDHNWALSTHEDGHTRLWDLGSGTCLRRFEPPPPLIFPGLDPDPDPDPEVPDTEERSKPDAKDKPDSKDQPAGKDKPTSKDKTSSKDKSTKKEKAKEPSEPPKDKAKKADPAPSVPAPKLRPALTGPQGEIRINTNAMMVQRGGVIGAEAPMAQFAGFGGFGGGNFGFGGGNFGFGGGNAFGGGNQIAGGQLGALGALGGNNFLGGPIPYDYATTDREKRVLAAVQTNSDVHLRDLESGRLLRSINTRGLDVLFDDLHTVTFAAFAPDGKTLLTAGADRAIRFWDVDSGMLFHMHEGLAEPVHMMHFMPDGKRLVTVAADGIIRVWEVQFGTRQE